MTITDFQKIVYDAISLIPKGQVSTYKDVARYLNCRSAQAIGQALKKNPFAPLVPCHRVVKSDFQIGGYMGSMHNSIKNKKVQLLIEEGVHVKNGQITDRSQLFIFPHT